MINQINEEIQKKSKSNSKNSVNKLKDDEIVTNVNFKHLQKNKSSDGINFYPLQKVIYVAGKEIEAIVDSGTNISILNTTLIPHLKIEGKGKIYLQSAFSEVKESNLAVLPVYYKKTDSYLYPCADSLFTLTEKLNIPCLINPDVYNTLKQASESCDIPSKEKQESSRNSDDLSANILSFSSESGGEEKENTTLLNKSVQLELQNNQTDIRKSRKLSHRV